MTPDAKEVAREFIEATIKVHGIKYNLLLKDAAIETLAKHFESYASEKLREVTAERDVEIKRARVAEAEIKRIQSFLD